MKMDVLWTLPFWKTAAARNGNAVFCEEETRAVEHGPPSEHDSGGRTRECRGNVPDEGFIFLKTKEGDARAGARASGFSFFTFT
jgi:hypothetical protein